MTAERSYTDREVALILRRAIWRRNTRKFREKLARLTESIHRAFDG